MKTDSGRMRLFFHLVSPQGLSVRIYLGRRALTAELGTQKRLAILGEIIKHHPRGPAALDGIIHVGHGASISRDT